VGRGVGVGSGVGVCSGVGFGSGVGVSQQQSHTHEIDELSYSGHGGQSAHVSNSAQSASAPSAKAAATNRSAAIASNTFFISSPFQFRCILWFTEYPPNDQPRSCDFPNTPRGQVAELERLPDGATLVTLWPIWWAWLKLTGCI
jgi:hypothetical protein